MLLLQGPVLAAIDLAAGDEDVLKQASAMAKSLEARLAVCHVLPEMLQARMLFPQLAPLDNEHQVLLEEKAQKVLEAHVSAVTKRSIADFDAVIDTGSAHAGILNQVEEMKAGIVVLGPGSVAERVARYAPCAVLVARSSKTGSVLAATDFSDPSFPAVEAAAAESKRRGKPLRLIHCIEAAEPIVLGSEAIAMGVLPALPTDLIHQLEQDARERLQANLTRLGVPGETIVARHRAATGIVQAALDVPTELIVIGIRGRSNIARLLLGSVAEEILKTAPCSVLVVHLAR